ncbi:magnesium transporter [Alkalimarinus alittae]|uniref:Magnesium transporter MgtE n=1 Tax=Alkalimarinus alittae TaxID=2961619 RepID=A0ABY6MZD1_9ALTE|nr:magnesium transporter [Alkalimarinus alittae]UZE95211.1 magnesium transporter [Alkalimarinus alittae]
MDKTLEQTKRHKKIRSLNDALDSGALDQAARILNRGLSPSDIAHLLESAPPKERSVLWELIDKDLEGEILQYLTDEVRNDFLSKLNPQELITITEDFETDDLADVLQQLPEKIIQEVLDSMDSQDRHRLEEVLSYAEDTAGGLMNTDTITIRPDITIDVVLRYLRRHRSLPEMTDKLIVVNRKDEFIGTLPITTMLVSSPSSTVREVMNTDAVTISVYTSETEVANLFERRDLVSAPVLSSEGRLLGRITIDDVVDVIRDDADHSLMSMAGLDEEDDTFTPVFKTAKRRAVWLGINLITAFIASSVIGMFEATIEKVVALAVLMPIVASMGGIAGSQALTLVIRSMALGHISRNNIGWLLNREFIVGVLNGLVWALVVAAAAIVWFNDLMIGAIIAAALLINLIVAAVAGTMLPVILRARNIDPALAGGVILTTITDVVGFLSFLGLATIIYA